VDGNDVLAVHAVTAAALERARSGNGPTLIEAYTYRMGAHTTSDDPTKYRLADELEHWRLKDPIERVRAYLSRNGAADEDFFAEVEAEADALAAHVRQACLSMPEPAGTEIFEHVYRDRHPLVDEERAWFEEYHAGFADGGPGHAGAQDGVQDGVQDGQPQGTAGRAGR
jgi:pyruvate dehydrogenase E1 component alpha subunit